MTDAATTNETIEAIAMEIRPLRLDHLPIIGQALARLGLRDIVDQQCPPDPRLVVTHGECVEAMIAAILLGKHALYAIGGLLRPYDLDAAFGWKFDPTSLNDERFGRTLDALAEAGLLPINAAATVKAVKVHALDTSRLHLDTTTAVVHGDYLDSIEPEDPDAPGAIPHITRGYSKDHRPDLKQIVFGLSVTADGSVPIYGRIASGNRNDPEELRYTMRRIREVVPNPIGTRIVGDSKLFSGETLRLAREFGMHFNCMLPRGVGLWGEAYTAYRAALAADHEPEILKGVEIVDEEGNEVSKSWKGFSRDMTYRWSEGEGDAKRDHELPLRALVVESSSLRQQKLPMLEARRAKDRERIEKSATKLGTRAFKCQEDAERAAIAKRDRLASDFFEITYTVTSETRAIKRERPGRPRADSPRESETVWRTRLAIAGEHTSIDELVHRESCYVLVTSLPRTGPDARSDADVHREYQEQNGVEACMHWLKGPLAVAPIFLKTPERIAGLGLVYVLALMVYALIQRDMRRRLATLKELIPGNKGWTDQPTTEVIFRLFYGVTTLRLGADGPIVVTNLTTPQLDAMRLFDCPILSRPDVRLTAPTMPAPGMRGGGEKKKPPKPKRPAARNAKVSAKK